MGNVYYGGCFFVPSTLVTMLYLLTQHPDELAKLIVAIRGINIDHDYDALLGCAPLDNALRETMRLLPSVPIFSRRVLPTDGTELGGQFLPQNTNLFISSWLLQRSTQYWEQPLVFNPDRWDNGVAEANPLGSDYFFPEGRGPRICLGAEYSLFFMKLVIATLLQTSRFECGAGQTYNAGQKFFFGVRMPAGLRGRFEPQNDR
jgi:cytochrome P450